MYIKLFIHHIETYGMSERRAVNIFMSSVQGPLIDALYDLPKDPKWDEMILVVRRRWNPGGTLEHLNSRFMTEVRKPQEEPREYAARLRRPMLHIQQTCVIVCYENNSLGDRDVRSK